MIATVWCLVHLWGFIGIASIPMKPYSSCKCRLSLHVGRLGQFFEWTFLEQLASDMEYREMLCIDNVDVSLVRKEGFQDSFWSTVFFTIFLGIRDWCLYAPIPHSIFLSHLSIQQSSELFLNRVFCFVLFCMLWFMSLCTALRKSKVNQAQWPTIDESQLYFTGKKTLVESFLFFLSMLHLKLCTLSLSYPMTSSPLATTLSICSCVLQYFRFYIKVKSISGFYCFVLLFILCVCTWVSYIWHSDHNILKFAARVDTSLFIIYTQKSRRELWP